LIIVKLNGGLGNQMFQYAFGRNIAEKCKQDLKLDVSDLNTFRIFELNIFPIKIDFATEKDLILFDRRTLSIEKKILQKIKSIFSTSTFFLESDIIEYYQIPDKKFDNIFIKGHWQKEYYFKGIEQIIRKNFSFPVISGDNNLKLLESIKSTNSISLHIRRGDYTLKQNEIVHGILPLSFYMQALLYMKERVNNPTFFIFSDDVEWVQKELSIEGQVFYVKGNENNNAYIDMQLMSYCKHNIIANSSFSWWGAWLNSNTDKIVIAPQQWFVDEIKNTFHKDLVPKEWIRL
jgi:hypothetical protein